MIWKMPRLRWNPRYTQRGNVYVITFLWFTFRSQGSPKLRLCYDSIARDRGRVMLPYQEALCSAPKSLSMSEEWADRLAFLYEDDLTTATINSNNGLSFLWF